MKLSIIMPVYNSQETIEAAIRSVITQNVFDVLELIVIDGGSTDNTMSIVEKYKENIYFYLSEKDNGYADALNKGIKVATGDFVMMLAADDRILPGAIEKIMSTIKADTDVWCGMIIEQMSYGYRFNISDNDLSKLYHECTLRHPATLFRRELFLRFGGYDTTYKCAADREIFLRFYTKGAKFQIEKIPVVLFSMNGMSINDPTKLAIPENHRISMQYGLNVEQADIDMQNELLRVKKINNSVGMKNFLAKMGVLPIMYKLAGKPDGCLSKSLLMELGIMI